MKILDLSKNKFALFGFIVIFSCNSNSNKSQIENNINNDKAFTTNQHINISKNLDFSIEDSIKKIGGYRFIKFYVDNKKCNLFKGIYILNKSISDSILLVKLGNKLAKDVYEANESDINCPFPKMSIAYVYNSQKDLKNKRAITACGITPSHPEGDSYVNRTIMYAYKILGRDVNENNGIEFLNLVNQIP